jgi:Fe-S cluster assembly protein SufD
MPAQEKILAHLEEVFLDMETKLNGSTGSSLHTFQRHSLNTLKQVQFPDRKHEDWKYTSVQKLITPAYQLTKNESTSALDRIPNLDSYVIPVLNGKVILEKLSPELMQHGITITSLQDAFQKPSWKEVFEPWVATSAITSNRAFELLNFTFHSNGFFIEIPKNLKLDKPIEIRVIHDDTSVSFSHPLFFIRAGSGSQIELFERFENHPDSSQHLQQGLINSLGYIHLEKNASVQHYKWQHLHHTINLVYKLLVIQEREADLKPGRFILEEALHETILKSN